MARYRLMFAQFPGNHVTDDATSGWVTETALKLERSFPEVEVLPWKKSDTPIPMVRNKAARVALESGCDYLLMVDNDMEPDPQVASGKLLYPGAVPFWEAAWGHMMSHRDEPCAVAAPYLGPPPVNNVYVFLWRSTNNDLEHAWSLEQFTREEAAQRTGVEEVAALPTGLVLYDTRVFATMPPPWFYYEYTDAYQSDKASTEDVTQTRDLSLAWHMSGGAKGGRVFCAWDSWARHIKRWPIDRPVVMTPEAVGKNLKAALGRPPAADRLLVVGGGNGQLATDELPPAGCLAGGRVDGARGQETSLDRPNAARTPPVIPRSPARGGAPPTARA